MIKTYDVIVIGGGAAGMMAAWQAGLNGNTVLLIEKESKVGKKIRISGGGRCNFTNIYASPDNYISSNPHFCKSALSQYTQYDFIDLVQKHHIQYYEKKLGQLFCFDSAQEIIDMLVFECKQVNVEFKLNTSIINIDVKEKYNLTSIHEKYQSEKLIVATGGLSIPKMGASNFAYQIAKQFGHTIVQTFPGLVPLKYPAELKSQLADLSGISIPVVINGKSQRFEENLLLTHHGFSGPAILQISSYINIGDRYSVDLLPQFTLAELNQQILQNQRALLKYFSQFFSKRFAKFICDSSIFKHRDSEKIDGTYLKNWELTYNGTLGYDKAEVTIGGLNVNEISSKTMESKIKKNLYFIGEALDVTGHLGGYNFQWAWSSGFVAGNSV